MSVPILRRKVSFGMANKSEAKKARRPRELLEIVEEVAVYPIDAYQFVQEGLTYSCERFFPGEAAKKVEKGRSTKPNNLRAVAKKAAALPAAEDEESGEDSRHITGRQLSEGLREYAWLKWGLMARTVLTRWNITSTMDFGKIVYALIDAQILSKTDEDRIDDFRGVFDFRTLESGYVLTPSPESPAAVSTDTSAAEDCSDSSGHSSGGESGSGAGL